MQSIHYYIEHNSVGLKLSSTTLNNVCSFEHILSEYVKVDVNLIKSNFKYYGRNKSNSNASYWRSGS